MPIQKPIEYPVTPVEWRLYKQADAGWKVKREKEGISFDFPVSPLPDPQATAPWAGYFCMTVPARIKSPVVSGSAIWVEFEIEATSNVKWNFRSGPSNLGAAPAAFHAYLTSGPLYSTDEMKRWWCTKPCILSEAHGVTRFVSPLDPAQWISTFGHSAADPVWTPGWKATLNRPMFLGMTFGGGYYYGHGVNVSDGLAKFKLRGMGCDA